MKTGQSRIPEIPQPEDYDPKEVYAFFGLASYCAQVLEQGLINMAVAFHLAGTTTLTRELIEQLFETMSAKTFGQLLREARNLVGMPEDLDTRLRKALRKRNRLVHNFFVAHSENFLSQAGRRLMITELREMIGLFSSTDKALDRVYLPLWGRLGITEERIEAELGVIKARVREEEQAK